MFRIYLEYIKRGFDCEAFENFLKFLNEFLSNFFRIFTEIWFFISELFSSWKSLGPFWPVRPRALQGQPSSKVE